MDSTARTGCIAAIVVLTLAAAVGVVVVIAGSGKPAATGAQAHQVAVQAKPETGGKDGPYPECPEIMKWLRDRSGEPKSLEIISWEGRADNSKFKGLEGQMVVTVRYRGKTAYGGMVAEKRFFFFKDGKMTHSTLSKGD